MEHVPADLLTARAPLAGESYLAYLDSFGLIGRGFAYVELVRDGSYRHTDPPARLWSRLVPTLALAQRLRLRMLEHGARGLQVAAAYRPIGGEANSQHKVNAALDLDLLPGDERFGDEFACAAAELWQAHQHLRTGVGTYAPAGALWTRRVHLDTGYRFRCWQGVGKVNGRHSFAGRPAVLELASASEAYVDGGVAADSDCTRQGAAWPTP